jgi:hypothetical protein
MQQGFTNKYVHQRQGERPVGRLTPVGDGVEQRGGHGGELVKLVVGPGHRLARGAPVASRLIPAYPVSSSSACGSPAPRRHVSAHEPQRRHQRRTVQEPASPQRVPRAGSPPPRRPRSRRRSLAMRRCPCIEAS